MGRVRCEHCGTVRRRTPAACRSCGRPQEPAEIAIEPLALNAQFSSITPSPSPTRAASPEVANRRGDATPAEKQSGAFGWVGLAIAALVMLAGLFFFDDGASDDAAEPEADPEASGAPTTPLSTSSTVAAAPTVARADDPSRTTTTIDPTPLVVENAALGIDDELLAIGVDGSLYGISLDDGGWTQGVAIEARPRDMLRPFIVVGDGIVLRRAPDQAVLLRPPFAPAWEQPWTTQADLIVPADSADRFGTMVVSSFLEPRIARIFTTDGEQVAETELPPNIDLHGVVGDKFLLGFGGDTVLFDPETRTASLVAEGRPLAYDGRRLLWESCDDALACTARSGVIDEPDQTEWPLLTPMVGLPGPVPIRLTDLDPTGATALSLEIGSATDRGRIVHHDGTNTAVHILPSDVFQTTAELVAGGSWVVFHVFRSENVLLWNPVTDERRSIPFPRQLMGFALRH